MKIKFRQPSEEEILSKLHARWTPHKGQIPVGKAIFHDKKYLTWIQCGRKWGKTDIAIYSIVRWALCNPNKECWYVGPYLKQVRKIAWRRILNAIPPEYIKHINRSDSEITLINDTRINIEGSDNPDASRGFTVHFCVYEEFKDFHPEYHDECMGPNLDAFSAPLVVIGTPPSSESFFTIMADEAKADPDAAYFEVSCYDNPHINQDAVKRKENQLIARGEWAKAQREYHGKFIKGGAGSIFPMFKQERHVMQHNNIMDSFINKDSSHLEWYCMADPGTTTAFGVLFAAINPYTKKVFILDNILAESMLETSTLDVWPRMKDCAQDLYPEADGLEDDDWSKHYDQAGAWFANEIMRHHGVSFMPVDKHLNTKEDGLGLIKDLMNADLIVFSDRCQELIKELEGYQTDKNGKIPKKNDHLIDCLRYILGTAMYDINEVDMADSKKETRELIKKSRRMDDNIEDTFKTFINS